MADRVQFTNDDNLNIGDKEGRVWNKVTCDNILMNPDNVMGGLSRVYNNLSDKNEKFTRDVPMLIDSYRLGIISQIFCDFGVRMGIDVLKSGTTTTGGVSPVPIYKFYSYKEVSLGKQPGFHLTVFLMGLNDSVN